MADPRLEVDLDIRVSGFRVRPKFTAGAEIVVLFGPSGAGKSLTLRALAGLVPPAAGRIRLSGRVLDDVEGGIHLRPQERRLGYVPQNYALFPHLTLFDNVAYGLRHVPAAERRLRVNSLLDRMRLRDRADWRPGELSGGQQQRAALARALAPSPEILLMDEPLGAVEETLRAELREEVRQIQAQDQIPVVLVTHSLAEAYSLAERLVVIVEGVVRQAGEREQVFRRPVGPEVARLVGMTNVMAGTVEASGPDRLELRWGKFRLKAAETRHMSEGSSVRFGIRPEDLMVLREPPAVGTGENVLEGQVTSDQPQGYDHLLGFEVDGAPVPGNRLMIRIPHPVVGRLGLGVGARRFLAIRPEAVHVFPPEPPGQDATGPDKKKTGA